jgi:fucose permease
MVMAIVGGGIISAILGVAQKAYGPIAIVFVPVACMAYLFVLGIFSAIDKSRNLNA